MILSKINIHHTFLGALGYGLGAYISGFNFPKSLSEIGFQHFIFHPAIMGAIGGIVLGLAFKEKLKVFQFMLWSILGSIVGGLWEFLLAFDFMNFMGRSIVQILFPLGFVIGASIIGFGYLKVAGKSNRFSLWGAVAGLFAGILGFIICFQISQFLGGIMILEAIPIWGAFTGGFLAFLLSILSNKKLP